MDETYLEQLRGEKRQKEALERAVHAFRKNPSERNKEKAFLRFYGTKAEEGALTSPSLSV